MVSLVNLLISSPVDQWTTTAQKLQHGIIILLLVGLTGCSSFARLGIGVTPIQQVRGKWQLDSTVYLRGQVVNQVPLQESWAYEVQDSTGTIWVFTHQPVPDGQILLKGKVQYQSVPIDNQDVGEAYILEEARIETKPEGTVHP